MKPPAAFEATSWRFSAEDLARIAHETESVNQDLRTLQDTHGQNTLDLVVVVGYLKSLLGNANVVKFLARRYPDWLSQFQKLVESTSLESGSGESAAASA